MTQQELAQRFPGEPMESILRWADELIEVSEEGIWLLDSEFPQLPEIDFDDRPQVFLASLRNLLGAGDAPEIGAGQVELFRQAFLRSSWRALMVA